jgi:hypothetical protein
MPSNTPKDGKGRIRALNRRGSKTGKLHAGELASGRPPEPRACDRCGALYARRVWRRGAAISGALLDRVTWTVCPACRQSEQEAGHRNVAFHAEGGQPERRIVALTGRGAQLEVLTTSQKLAHRIVRELLKAFKGRARYAWSDDGTLFARWRRDLQPATATATRRARG